MEIRRAGDREAALAEVSDTELLNAFRESLLAVYPVLKRLSCLEDDTQPYDEFDQVAETLWETVVLGSLRWRDGLDRLPELPRYGYAGVVPGPDGYIEVRIPGSAPFRFIGFAGSREFGPEPFNAVHGVTSEGSAVAISLQPNVSFRWVR